MTTSQCMICGRDQASHKPNGEGHLFQPSKAGAPVPEYWLLTIKGSKQDALRAACEFKIPLQILKEADSGTYTLASVPYTFKQRIDLWFTADTLYSNGAKPMGSLLLYRPYQPKDKEEAK